MRRRDKPFAVRGSRTRGGTGRPTKKREFIRKLEVPNHTGCVTGWYGRFGYRAAVADGDQAERTVGKPTRALHGNDNRSRDAVNKKYRESCRSMAVSV